MATASEWSIEIDQWLDGKPAEPALRRVREVIVAADPRMTEYLKYGTVQFAYEGDFANFVQHNERRVRLMFNRGAKIPGRFPHVEGSGPSARFMRFADLSDVDERAKELTSVVAAWCSLALQKSKRCIRARSKPLPPARRPARC